MTRIAFFTFMLLLGACNLSYKREPELDSTFEKMYGTNETMKLACAATLQHSDKLWEELQQKAQSQPSAEAKKMLLHKGESIRLERAGIISHINAMRDRLVQLSGGYHLGQLVGAKDKHQADYTLSDNKDGAGYQLAGMILAYKQMMKQRLPEFPMDGFPVADASGKTPDDLAKYYFEDLPSLPCLTLLYQIELEVLLTEVRAMDYMLLKEE